VTAPKRPDRHEQQADEEYARKDEEENQTYVGVDRSANRNVEQPEASTVC